MGHVGGEGRVVGLRTDSGGPLICCADDITRVVCCADLQLQQPLVPLQPRALCLEGFYERQQRRQLGIERADVRVLPLPVGGFRVLGFSFC